MSILLTGGSGLLGKELYKLRDDFFSCFGPRDKGLDITKPESIQSILAAQRMTQKPIDLIVHCAAYTDVAQAELDKTSAYQTNAIGTRNLAALGIPMLYISTEYVFDGTKGNYNEQDYPNPQNFYATTKLLGEQECRACPRSTVIRCLFKPRPFEHAAACVDQFTSGDYVDVIAQEIAHAIKAFDSLPATIHIGTGRKSTYELACQTRSDILSTTVSAITGVKLPRDTSLNTNLWEKIKNVVS